MLKHARYMKKIFQRFSVTVLAVAMACTCLSGCSGSTSDTDTASKSPLDPDNPVTLTIWHYYNGAQQNAFDALVDEFNTTVGKDEGIFVQGISQGSVSDLQSAVKDSLAGKVGSNEMPNIFSSYADTAYEVAQADALANISDYLTEEEIDTYVDSYIEEGRITDDGALRIFPIAKSTEIMMLNKTDWDVFAAETGASLDQLSTIEGLVAVAEQYYEWTDAQTPDIANDGKAFYGRDSIANYFSIGMRQLGYELFEVEDGEVTFNTDKEAVRKIWEGYYVPFIKGYFGAYGSFRSDDVKTGDLLAYTGSTTSCTYFPDEVETDDGRYAIDYVVLPAPIFEDGENYMVQQGAGMVVTKSDEAHEYASVEFLKWFTQTENNILFCCNSGYLPVLKEANDTQVLDQVIADNALEISSKSYDCITTAFETLPEAKLYTNKSFRGGTAARDVLDAQLSDAAAADRAEVEHSLAQGMTLEEACAPYLTDEAFTQWYDDFCAALDAAVAE